MTETGDQHPVTDLAGYFAGYWRLEREIFDESGTRIGSFTGTAAFTVDGAVLAYQEQGVLEFGSHQGPAQRALRYELTGPGQAEVYFDYGDFFHSVDLREGWWATTHPCRDDLYRGEYRMIGPDRWRQEWHVAGPTKNHVLITRFDRVQGQ